jgi:hypothetical protein
MGKPESATKKKDVKKSPIGVAAVGTYSFHPNYAPASDLLCVVPMICLWVAMTDSLCDVLVLLIFVVIAPLFIEQLKMVPYLYGLLLDGLAKIGLVSR